MKIAGIIAVAAITAMPSAALAAENGLSVGQQLIIVGGCVIVGGFMGGDSSTRDRLAFPLVSL